MEEIVKPNVNNLNLQVYKYIQNKIISNELQPGSRIYYEKLAEEVGVSITPVRDALNWLQKDGFVEIKPRSGTYVKSFTTTDVIEILHVRNALEREAVGLATNNIPIAVLEKFLQISYDLEKEIKDNDFTKFIEEDRIFHQTIAHYANNSRLKVMLDMVDAQVKWIGLILLQNRERFLLANQHHKDIIKAMMDRNAAASQEQMVNHIMEIKRIGLIDFDK